MKFTKVLQNRFKHEKLKTSRLPRVIWTEILSFCSHATLAKIELVNKQFFTLINPQCNCLRSNNHYKLRAKKLQSTQAPVILITNVEIYGIAKITPFQN